MTLKTRHHNAAQHRQDIAEQVNTNTTDITTLENAVAYVFKATDESVSSADTGTTLQDDDDLQVTLAANGIYQIEAFVSWTSASATPDVKWQFIEPDGAFYLVGVFGDGSGTGIWQATEATGATVKSIAAGGSAWATFNIRAIAGGSGGVFKLQWAQNTSSVTATTCEKGSWMNSRKLN